TARVRHGLSPPCMSGYRRSWALSMTVVIGGEGGYKPGRHRGTDSTGRRGGDGGHPDAPPHVQDEERGSGELGETAEGDGEPEEWRGREAAPHLGGGAQRGPRRHEPVDGLRQLWSVMRVV